MAGGNNGRRLVRGNHPRLIVRGANLLKAFEPIASYVYMTILGAMTPEMGIGPRLARLPNIGYL